MFPVGCRINKIDKTFGETVCRKRQYDGGKWQGYIWGNKNVVSCTGTLDVIICLLQVSLPLLYCKLFLVANL